MVSVGQQIREQRLRLGLKLEEISAKSRIPLKTLLAIEGDDLPQISSPFLYKSFARQFAEHVKLEPATLIPALESALVSMPQPRMPGEGETGKTNLPPLALNGREKNYRWLYSVASLAFVLVACSSLYGVWQNSKYTWRAELSGLLSSPKTPAQSSAAGTNIPPGVRPSPPPVAPQVKEDSPVARHDSSRAAAKSPEFRVELSALERSWLSIVEDGRQTFSGILDPDQTKILTGHDIARIRTGNAGGISCVFNGQPIGTLGERGQTRTVVFTTTDYKVLEPSAHVAALISFPIAE